MSERDDRCEDALDTLAESFRSFSGRDGIDATVLSLGIIWHRDLARIGAVAPLRFDREGQVLISRLAPDFIDPRSGERAPLLDRHLSRTPLKLKRLSDGQFQISPSDRLKVEVNGRSISGTAVVSMEELGEEIIITLSKSVVLSIFNAPARSIVSPHEQQMKLVGISRGVALTRDTIARIAVSDIPIFIHGETGTGKELVARAIHSLSERARKQMVSTNMAAIAPSLAAAELFGTKKGAFTGATRDKLGLFEQAHGGTLFLDEIGDVPKEVQPMLLRTLEFGEVRRIGSESANIVDVRIISATDRNLEQNEDGVPFNQPLFQRLQGIKISVPPLRRRRVDIGLLCKVFWEVKNRNIDWVSFEAMDADQMTRLAIYNWPGNIRELRNKVQQIQLGEPAFRDDILTRPEASIQLAPPVQRNRFRKYKNATDVSESELIEALDAANWIIKDAASALGISRTALYDLMAKSSNVRNIEDIGEQELRDVIAMVPGGLDAWVKHLHVGREALRRRIQSLGGTPQKSFN